MVINMRFSRIKEKKIRLVLLRLADWPLIAYSTCCSKEVTHLITEKVHDFLTSMIR